MDRHPYVDSGYAYCAHKAPGSEDECGWPRGNARHAPEAPAPGQPRPPRPLGPSVAVALDAPATSARAALRALPASESWKGRVLDAIRQVPADYGMTDAELIAAIDPERPNSIRPRRIDLSRDGWLTKVLVPGTGEPLERDGSVAHTLTADTWRRYTPRQQPLVGAR